MCFFTSKNDDEDDLTASLSSQMEVVRLLERQRYWKFFSIVSRERYTHSRAKTWPAEFSFSMYTVDTIEPLQISTGQRASGTMHLETLIKP